MAKVLEKETVGTVGFDPLEWMNDEPEVAVSEVINEKIEESEVSVVDDVQGETEIVEVEAIVAADENTELEGEVPIEAIEQDVETGSESKITLDATLNIQTVGALYDQFLKMLDTQNIIEIDASSVESIDTATLQLITVFKQAGIKLQKEISVDFPSDKFVEAAEILGLAELLEVDQAAAGFF